MLLIAYVTVGPLTGVTALGLNWATSGESSDGILGVKITPAGVGLVVGALLDLVDGVINGRETTVAWFNQVIENQIDMNAKPITV